MRREREADSHLNCIIHLFQLINLTSNDFIKSFNLAKPISHLFVSHKDTNKILMISKNTYDI